LKSEINAQYINVTELVKRENLTIGIDKIRKTLIADLDKLSKRLQQKIEKSRKSIIIESNFIINLLSQTKVSMVFVLRRDPFVLKRTLLQRGYSEKKVNENVAAEILDSCLWDTISNFGIEKVCEIDTTNKSIETVVKEIILVLEQKKKCQIGTVDWLIKLEKENRLKQFFNNY
jgi:adenylate kinase